MQKVGRILAHVCKDGGAPQAAAFLQSVVDQLAGGGGGGGGGGDRADQLQVDVSLHRNQFVLSAAQGGGGVLLRRPAFCPIKHLSVTEAAAVPLDVQRHGVDVGVAILLQSANHRVLLTRRAAGLRVFPGVWVPPGGHVEPDETLLAAGLRELQEETGLKLEPDDVCPQILGLWESVYPPMLSRGSPQRHHIVTYMLLHSPLTHLQLQAALRPSPAEVSSCLWLDVPLAAAVVSAVDGDDSAPITAQDLPTSLSVSDVGSDGALSVGELPLATLLSRAPAGGADVERVSTGTKFALELWLDTHTHAHTHAHTHTHTHTHSRGDRSSLMK
ncbi:m7GpppN-mRNA hydrolase NUDT17 [Myripristis murdjan]|uniref:m7GpppN-mRNA hydrolase NUDT17 n=1 Tax=Myripristis murdjan TaxID=586833 RepID=A0A667Z464_9TELE|nr:nucleoside diphosphate-linked moiety X motif 17 [Myripristis murdjan]